MIPGLKVRIKNKHFQNGELYNCKTFIEDVLDTHKFTIRVQNRIIEDLCEKDIQTIIPPLGSNVRIVKGEHKGEISKLLSKDRNTATIQLLDQILHVKLGHICDYLHD